jgi:hypothetical protein
MKPRILIINPADEGAAAAMTALAFDDVELYLVG